MQKAHSSPSHSLRKHHLQSVVISVCVNALLIMALLYVVQLPSDQAEDRVSIRVQNQEVNPEETIDPTILEEPEITQVEETDLSFDTSLEFVTDLTTETESAAELEANVIPTMSPVKLMSMALQTGPVTLGGSGMPMKGTTQFMGQKGEGERIAFVIDYSKSMKKLQLDVMKYELYSAIQKIGETGLVSILFFSGPVWRPDQDAEDATKRWTGSNGEGWRVKDGEEGANPQWFLPNRNNLAAIQRMIYTTPTTYGTDWYPPMKLALETNPRPDVIFFMTDGSSPRGSIDRTLEMIDQIPPGSVQINTVALGLSEDKADPLKQIAEKTGGHFRLYTSEQLKEVLEKIPEPPDEFSDRDLKYMSAAEVIQRSLQNQQAVPQMPVNDDVVTFDI